MFHQHHPHSMYNKMKVKPPCNTIVPYTGILACLNTSDNSYNRYIDI